MVLFKKTIGQKGENLACQFLKKQGYKILARNSKFRFGEIDILARDRKDLVLVEVKAKTTQSQGSPLEKVDWKKQKKLWQLAQFLNQQQPDSNIRIDVIGIEWDPETREPKVEHIKNAIIEE